MLLYSVCGAVGTIIVTLLFNNLSGFQLQSFSLWFVIPVGGIYVGLGAISGLYYYLFKHNKPFLFSHITYKIFLVSLILGGVTFLGIYYFSYIIENHIPAISFIKYLKIEATSGESFFAINKIPSSQGVDMGGPINSIYFYLQILGVLIGSLWPLSLKLLISFRVNSNWN